MTTARLNRHDLEAKIVKRCWDNDTFRKEFLADPAGCFAKYLNAPKAQLPKLVVHEEQPGTWHIVVPAKPRAAGELSDDELERVAGGTDIVVSLAMSAVVTAGVVTGVTGYEGAKDGW